ncbi:hypothetical protein [Azospirillum sp.]|uniref:hypothetical protein n=1 Tax=Azospirillum sp. TaxID=34012 RepID=UPI003D73D041
MNDVDSLKCVVGWSLGGLVASSVVIAALILTPPPEGDVVTERAVASLDQQTCKRMMDTFVEQSRSGAQIIWLWAEESTPRVFGAGPWSKQQVDPSAPPRPYAFHPGSQTAPPQACSFPENTLHIVAVEPEARADTFIGAGLQ